jgi:hypothetical protein
MHLDCRLVIVASLPLATAYADYIEEFQKARRVEISDPQACVEGMVRSFHQAEEAGNCEYTSAAGLNACSAIYKQGKVVECGKLAREVISAVLPLEDLYPESTTLRSVQFFGYMERGLMAEGKVGAAWQANRAAAERLRGKKVSASADGPSITLADLDDVTPALRSGGLRLIEREADLLDTSGQSNEARKLLDAAAVWLGNDWQDRLDETERFYAFKLLAARAELVDFLGYNQEAIQAQQDLIQAVDSHGIFKQSHLTLRINLLRNLSQWSGHSQEILDQAREIATQMKAHAVDHHIDRLLAKMEFDFKQSREPIESLRLHALKNQALGDSFEVAYAERDNLFARVSLGEENLDPEFHRLLRKLRSYGNKRSEPSLFCGYGRYLLQQNRPAEATLLLAESLRMTRSFGWVLHEPNLIGLLMEARIATGDLASARTSLAELDQWLANHPDSPTPRRAAAVGIRANALAKLNERSAAREAFRLARQIAKNLPPYQQSNFSPEQEEKALGENKPPIPAEDSPPKTAPFLRVQPLEVVGMAVPSDTSRTRFTVFNPTAQQICGHFLFTGPGATDGKTILFTAGQPVVTLQKPLTISGGNEAATEVLLAPSAGVDAAKVQVAWQNKGQPAGPVSTWEVVWNPTTHRQVVLDASWVEANPFRSVSLFHELAVPMGGVLGIPFRLRSPVALRFEYLDTITHELVAVDANGNGDFSEAGDLHIRGPGGVCAAIFPITPGDRTLTVEVRISSPEGLPLATAGEPLVLEAEVYQNGVWTKEAEDTFR